MKRIALIVGAGPGLSASLARALAKRALHVVLAARDTSDLRDLASEVGATTIDCDASARRDMASLFQRVDALDGTLEVAVYNASHRVRGPIAELDPVAVEAAISVSGYGAFLMAHHAAKRMLVKNSGALLFTGAKGFAESAPFAMGKFALRGLCQSLARELHPKGIHVGHILIDGTIAVRSSSDAGHADDMLDPDEIAKSYMALIDQHRSAWTSEFEIRPWAERF
ncbi:SDR family NAD(P)-dependent oxidoreductase [Gymnodinialimonas sp. 2305UL16-5]|uniref:SDR family NAD(P)-dependent oxidoreductase n=1 Tax=Gymnodinialimonas mytili TaxID=3126503 RepID=UPI0030A41F51